MKTRYLYRSLLLLALGLGLTTCRKEKDPTPLERLPAATTEGKNTWGCLVNGEAWTSSGSDNMRADWTVQDICSCNMSFSRRSVSLILTRDFIPGVYQLGSQPNDSLSRAKVNVQGKLYEYNLLHKGMMTITRLDRQAGIMSGTFDFVMADGPGDTLRVTNGRFDIGNMDR